MGSEPTRTPRFTQEEWAEAFVEMLANGRTALYGRAFSVVSPKEQRLCAEWLAHSVMEASKNVIDG